MDFPRYLLPLCVTLIFTLGLVMIFNTTSAEVLDLELSRSTHQALIRQLIFAVLSCGMAYGAWVVGHRTLLSLSGPLLIFGCALLALTFLPGVSYSANGARRWVRLAGYTLQPSELVKLLMPLYCIHHLDVWGNKRYSRESLLRLAAAMGVPMGMVALEPDNGTVGIMVLTLLALCGLYRVQAKYWVVPVLALVVVGSVAAVKLPYVRGRIAVYLNPELDLRGRGHQPHQARIAAGSGKLVGKGPGNSWQKLSYLPEAQNDYIAAIYAEEFGFLGILLLIGLYMAVSCLGFYIASLAADLPSGMLAGVATFLLSVQAFLNLGVVSGLLPSTGLNLPFFSQGGTSLMANTVVIGVLLSIWDEGKGRAFSPALR